MIFDYFIEYFVIENCLINVAWKPFDKFKADLCICFSNIIEKIYYTIKYGFKLNIYAM